MNKYLYICTLAGQLLISCQKENEQGLSNDPVEVSFTATTQGDRLITYGSEEGGVSNLDFATHSLRYIMEIYDASNALVANQTVKIVTATPTTVNFDTRLVPGVYQFVFWADIVDKSNPLNDLHYNTSDLTNITFKNAYFGNDDTKDAYTTVKIIDVRAGMTQHITLTRPFGKIRVLATDTPDNSNKWSKLRYYGNLPAGFNALTGEPLTSVLTDPEYAVAAPVYGETGPEQTMAWDYIFTPAAGASSYTFDVTVYSDAGISSIKTKLLTNVPIQRNKLTTITGNFFN